MAAAMAAPLPRPEAMGMSERTRMRQGGRGWPSSAQIRRTIRAKGSLSSGCVTMSMVLSRSRASSRAAAGRGQMSAWAWI